MTSWTAQISRTSRLLLQGLAPTLYSVLVWLQVLHQDDKLAVLVLGGSKFMGKVRRSESCYL